MTSQGGVTSRRRARRALQGCALLALGAMLVLLPRPAGAQWQISSPDGVSSLKMGFLLQGRADFEQNRDTTTPSVLWTAQNIYLRRLRLIMGAELDGGTSVFADTDCPNYGKVTSSTGTKDYPDLYLQDFVVTRKAGETFRLDTGLILTPDSYNHLQSAASLLAMDYGPYTFVESTPLKAKVGRDIGLQGRGIVSGGHLEYRLGAFQGIRQGHATSAFRTVGRLMWSAYPLEASLFYSGTTLGKKQALTLGLSADVQNEYRSYHADLHLDRPLGPGTSFAFLADAGRTRGGALLPTLPAQRDYLVEAGISLFGNRFAPYAQLARQDVENSRADETTAQAGAAWWLHGHKATVKIAWARVSSDALGDRNQLLTQYQAFSF